MPRFDVRTTQKTIPIVPEARSTADVGAIGRAIASLGQATSEQAAKWDRLHADTQFSNAKRIASNRMGRQLSEELTAETDPERYEELYQNALKDVERARPRHAQAGRDFDLWLNAAQPSWNQGLFKTYQNRILKNARDSQAAKKAEALTKLEGAMIGIAKVDGWDEVEKFIASPETLEELNAKGISLADAKARLEHAKAFDAVRENAEKEQFKKDQAVEIAKISKATVQRVNDISDLDKALDAGYITATEYRTNVKLRSAGTAKVSDLVARADVIKAIQAKNQGSITEQEALKVLYANSTKLTASDNNKFQEDMISVGDPSKSRSFTRAQSLMSDLIRDKDPVSGFFTDDEDQIVGDAQGTLQLSQDMEAAAKAGKPMSENEIIIRAIEIGQQIKRDIKVRKEQPTTRKVKKGILRTVEEAIPASELKKAPDLRIFVTPDGFENVWPKLDSATRESVLLELETGTNPKEIIDHLERKLNE